MLDTDTANTLCLYRVIASNTICEVQYTMEFYGYMQFCLGIAIYLAIGRVWYFLVESAAHQGYLGGESTSVSNIQTSITLLWFIEIPCIALIVVLSFFFRRSP